MEFNKEITTKEFLGVAVGALREAGTPEPEREAGLLLSSVLALKPSELYINGALVLDANARVSLKLAIGRRVLREPVQYIAGTTEFYSLGFTVGPEVLIPRPETELLVEEALKVAISGVPKEGSGPLVLDIGTGSGAVAVAIAKNAPEAQVTAADISEGALSIAADNAHCNEVAERIEFLKGDIFSALEGKGFESSFDIVVSNPPYVADCEFAALEPEVKDYEPRLALSGGVDGLDFYRRIVAAAPDYLKPGGMLLLEVGFGQADRVMEMIEEDGCFLKPESIKDLSGVDRVVKAVLL